MPIIKSAKKKLRQDKKRKLRNRVNELKFKKMLSEIRKSKTKKNVIELIKKAYSALDKAAKKKIIHKNKASRLKSGLAKFLKNK